MIVYSTRYLGEQVARVNDGGRLPRKKLIVRDRYLLDLHLRLPLQYDIQAPLLRLPGVHDIPNAQ